MKVKLTATTVGFEGKRLWLQDATPGDLERLDYKNGELGIALHVQRDPKFKRLPAAEVEVQET